MFFQFSGRKSKSSLVNPPCYANACWCVDVPSIHLGNKLPILADVEFLVRLHGDKDIGSSHHVRVQRAALEVEPQG